MINTIFTVITSVALSVGSFLGITSTQPSITPEIRSYVSEEVREANLETQELISEYIKESKKDSLVFGSTLPIAGSTYTLSGSGVTSSNTSITLSSLTLPQNGYEIVDADLSDTFYITLEPGNRTRQEIVGCTTVTQNANDTATLSGCTRGLSPISPYTASSSLQFSHAGGTQVIFSDPPQLFNLYVAKANDETITGTLTVPTPVSAGHAVTKAYVDALSFGSVATSTESSVGFVELATGLEQASSTVLGSTLGPVVLQAKNATSTYNSATAPLKVVVTQNNGKIDGNFLDLNSFSGSVTITGTSNIASTSIYATSTSGTWVKPANLRYLIVEAVGGGGGGGGCTTANFISTGGSGAGYIKKVIPASALSSTETLTIGSAGTAGSSGGGAGGNGGTTTLGSFFEAGGGIGGVGCSGSDAAITAGGVALRGDFNLSGGASSGGFFADNAVDTYIAAQGGDSVWGYGGRNTAVVAAGLSNKVGVVGTGYGSGASGASSMDGNDVAGAAGQPGYMVFTYVFY